MEGLWYTHFTAGPMHGDGMAVLRHGEILGGDPAHTYSGSYQFDGPNLYANVRVTPYPAAIASTATERPFTLYLKGSISGDSAAVCGHPDNKADLKIAVELHRAA